MKQIRINRQLTKVQSWMNHESDVLIDSESDSADEEVCKSEQNGTVRCTIKSRTTFHSQWYNVRLELNSFLRFVLLEREFNSPHLICTT